MVAIIFSPTVHCTLYRRQKYYLFPEMQKNYGAINNFFCNIALVIQDFFLLLSV